MHKIPLFAQLSRQDFEEIASQMYSRTYQKDEIILEQGQIPHALTIIHKGSAKAYRITPDGQEKILYIFSKNDFFGEQYLFSGKKSAYAVAALGPVQVCSFTKEHFQKLIYDHPMLAIYFIEELGRRVVQLERAMQSTGGSRVDVRIAALLLDFIEKYAVNTPRGAEIILPLSREGMANYLGIARETLSRKLSVLESEGILCSHGNKRLLVLRPDVLAKRAREE